MKIRFINALATSEVFGSKNHFHPATWRTKPFIFKNTEVVNIFSLLDCGLGEDDDFCVVEFYDHKNINRGSNYFKLIQENIIDFSEKIY